MSSPTLLDRLTFIESHQDELASFVAAFGFAEWEHPRAKNGMFIKVGGLVNVSSKTPGDRTKKRGQVVKLTRRGPVVKYADGTKETIPLANAKKRIVAAPPSFARLGDEAPGGGGRRIRNAPGAEDAWARQPSTRVNNAPGSRNAPSTPPAPGNPPATPPAPGTPPTPDPAGTPPAPTGTRRSRIAQQYGVTLHPAANAATAGAPTWEVQGPDGAVTADIHSWDAGGGRTKYKVTAADGTALGEFTDRLKALEAAGKHHVANGGATASGMTAASTAEYKEWEHLRGSNGQFITKGGAVNVIGTDGKPKRGTILAFTPEGPVVEYPDGTREVIPITDTSSRISQAPVAKARLSDADLSGKAGAAKITTETPEEADTWNKYRDGVLAGYNKDDECTKAAAEVVRSGSYTEDSGSCIGAADSPTAKLLLEMHNKGVSALPNADLGDEEKKVGLLAARMLNLDTKAQQDPKIARETERKTRQAASDQKAAMREQERKDRQAAADKRREAKEAAAAAKAAAKAAASSKAKAKKPKKLAYKDIVSKAATPTKKATAAPTGVQRANAQTSKRAKEQ